jgi:2-polyprenyl-6-methoxyphenol hydroxylase-like FAD-dependent oxidoreductase
VYHVGIILQGNCIRALERIGLADDAVAAGFPLEGVAFQDLHDRELHAIPGIKLASPQYPSDLGMSRPALHGVLTRAAAAHGVHVRTGTTFTTLDTSGPKPYVEFTDGTAGEYDFVVGADGVHSGVRATLFGLSHRPRFTGQGVWRYNVPRPPHLRRATMCIGLERGKCGFLPISEDTGYVLLVQAEPGNPRHPDERLAAIFRERLAACTGTFAALREQIVDPALVVYRPLEVILMPAPWYRNGVLLIGDAAHATTPHLGQGAAQAVEDAIVVAELLASGLDGDALGAAFMARRYERLRFIWEASVQIGAWELEDSPQQDAAGMTRRMMETVARPI